MFAVVSVALAVMLLLFCGFVGVYRLTQGPINATQAEPGRDAGSGSPAPTRAAASVVPPVSVASAASLSPTRSPSPVASTTSDSSDPGSGGDGESDGVDDGGDSDSGVLFKNCTEAWAAGAAPLYRGEPGYRAKLDGDGDGVACENRP